VPLEQWLYMCANVAVLEAQGNSWRFVHDKLRETIIADLPSDERLSIYQNVAEAYEKTYPYDNQYAVTLLDLWREASRREKERYYLRIAGENALRYSNFKSAFEYFSRLYVLNAADAFEERIDTKNKLGETLWYLTDYDQAKQYLQQALELARQKDYQRGAANALFWLSQVAVRRGDYQAARRYLQESLPMAQQLDDAETLARIYYGLADTAWRLDDLEASHSNVMEALILSHKINDITLELYALNRLGSLYFFRGDYETGKRYHLQNLQMATAVGNRERMAAALANLGEAARLQGDYLVARDYYTRALTTNQEMNLIGSVMTNHSNLGLAEIALGNLAAAHQHFSQVLQLARQHRANTHILYSILGFAQIRAEQGEKIQAAEWMGFILNDSAADLNVKNDLKPYLAALSADLGPDTFKKALEDGARLPLDEIVRVILNR
jgi:tetratricopeptide (TPR) repeat protein